MSFPVFLSHSLNLSIVAAALMTTAVITPASAAGPFAGFAGTWRGSGTVSTSDGAQESIRCKATYGVDAGGNSLNINVACASDSYRVNLISTVMANGTSLSGSWQETTRQISGDVAGRIPSPNTLQATMQAMGGGLELVARTNGRSQAISIMVQGSDIKDVSITLRKG